MNSFIFLLASSSGKVLVSALTKYIVPYSKNNETAIAVISAAILVEFLIGLYATFSTIIPITAQETIDIMIAGIKPTCRNVVTAKPI
ncbi:hypothetical protein SDC9_178004 [bioreactor metagenome]|uniref:Uncharacterized protein n=1 Tax=bioreactor metagenome TaxID=1076179 RepID=A0A645H3Y1_9ZZZZ